MKSLFKTLQTLSLAAVAAGPAHGFQARARLQLWGYLVIVVMLLSAVEWLTYHRRLTV